MRDLYSNIDVRRAISPTATIAGDSAIVSEIIDMRGYSAMVVLIQLGSVADVDATFKVLNEEGDDSGLSDNAAVADGDLNGTETLVSFDFADDNLARKIGYHGSKRYVRMTITPSGNSSGDFFMSASAIMHRAAQAPIAQQT